MELALAIGIEAALADAEAVSAGIASRTCDIIVPIRNHPSAEAPNNWMPKLSTR